MLRSDIKNNFIEYLQSSGKITKEQKDTLVDFDSFADLEVQMKREGVMAAEELAEAKAGFFNMTYIDLVGEKMKPEVFNTIPKELAETYKIIVYAADRSTISVALVEPTNLKAQEAVEFLARKSSRKVEFAVISNASFLEAFRQYSALKTEVEEYLGVAKEKLGETGEEEEGPATAAQVMDKAEDKVSSAPIAKMVSVILRHAVEEKASDIHIEPVMNQTRVRYRVDGILRTSLVLPKYVHSAIVSRIKVMSKLKIDETRIPQDGRIRIKIGDRNVDFRVSTLPLHRNEKVVMRILESSQGTITLESLGFVGRNLEVINENIHKPHGLFLVTGPTGSGKTTTLYSALQILNREEVNIVTLEDPVEYFLKGINQSQINPEVGLTFAAGLRSILRQDPDIVMVGEIRDGETAELAIHASLTGHVVLSTLHTNDAFGAIPRLVDLKVEAFLLASTLNVVIAQRLVRKLCQDCKGVDEVPEQIKKGILAEISAINPKAIPPGVDLKKIVFWKGRGCQRCGSTGYVGRLAIAEVLAVDDKLKEIITSRDDWSKIKEYFLSQGMLTLKQDGLMKALMGQTTIEEILRVTRE